MSQKHPSGEQFEGVIGRTVGESKPWWPQLPLPKGSPDWLRAQDIAMAARAELERQRDRK